MKRSRKRRDEGGKLYSRLLQILFVAIVFFALGRVLSMCNKADEVALKKIFLDTGAKDMPGVVVAYRNLEAKYEASAQTIKELQLAGLEANAIRPNAMGSLNSGSIPEVKPPQNSAEEAKRRSAQPKLSESQLFPPVNSEAGHVSHPIAGKELNLRGGSNAQGFQGRTATGKTALVVICYNRPKYLEKTLGSIMLHYPDQGGPDVFISQDGNNLPVQNVISKFKLKFKENHGGDVTHLKHVQAGGANGYEKLAKHFGWALKQLFEVHQAKRVIILEDDLEIAPDFFDYFLAMAPILDDDDTVMAVSAWNDNGQSQHVTDAKSVVRSDFFPGLGWMLNERVWKEWGPKWPRGYWDDWLREPPQRKGRVTLRPEISRTHTFGVKGVSHAQFFKKFLGSNTLSKDHVAWGSIDFSYLKKDNFDAELKEAVNKAREVRAGEAKANRNKCTEDLKVKYNSLHRGPQPTFFSVASILGIMQDSKAKVPRTAYNGVVQVRCGHGSERRIFVVPSETVRLV
jgi:alpha-1,3-mannosyl-glycoprotein beta-1,2-N-acetylglucosaminyltransferase